MKKLLVKIRKMLKDRRTRRMLKRFISITAALVVFITTYALVMPAITMEAEADCGVEAHQHDDSCFEDVLACDTPESEGHRHGESCYRTSSELLCALEEHRHVEGSCYDADGNLVCAVVEHTHDESCYKEVRDLTCLLEESEGHSHDSSCYEKVLTCGKEVHTHSEACYHAEEAEPLQAYGEGTVYDDGTDSTGVSSYGEEDYYEENYGVETDGAENYGDEGGGTVAAGAAGLENDPADGSENSEGYAPADESEYGSVDGSENSGGCDAGTDSTAGTEETAANTNATVGTDEYNAGADNTAAAQDSTAGTDSTSTVATQEAAADADTTVGTTAADSYVPHLDQVDFQAVLNSHTGIYCHPVRDGEIIENSTSLAADQWTRVGADTELGKNDLLRVYLAYTIPAGTLNTTNSVARYSLPHNIHLADSQIKAINGTENGIAGQYISRDTLEILDPDKYHRYLGAEAVEGTRRPDQNPNDYLYDLAMAGKDAVEYVSATVQVENVYDDHGDYLGQDILFTFTPYTVEKNRHEYDTSGQPTRAGEKVRGWFTFDLTTGQVDWGEPVETILPADQTVIRTATLRTEQTAEVVFVENGRGENNNKNKEISTLLTMVDLTEIEVEETSENPVADVGETGPEAAIDENAETDRAADPDAMGNAAGKDAAGDDSHTSETDKDKDKDKDKEEKTEYKDGTLEASGAGYKITLDYKADAKIPENAYLHVMEITRETDAEAYEACLEEARKTVPAGSKSTVDDKASRFFDIEILVDEKVAGTPANTPADEKTAGTPANTPSDEKAAGTPGNEKSEEVLTDEKAADESDAEGRDDDNPAGMKQTFFTTEENQAEDAAEGNGDAAEVNTETVTRKIEPAASVVVNIQLFDTEISKDTDLFDADQYKVVHFAEDGTEEIRDVTAQIIGEEQEHSNSLNGNDNSKDGGKNTGKDRSKNNTNSTGTDNSKDSVENSATAPPTEIRFEAESFSIYGIVYTVDFHYEVDGRTYEFSIPGGGFVSLEHLVEVLGIAGADKTTEGNEADPGADVPASDQAVKLNEIKVSEATREFVADVAGAEFSSPKLVWVGKADSAATVGGLKETNGLEVEYSADLTEDRIAEINAQKVEAGDWALISLQPFTSTENLTVTMRNGEKFIIHVTDYQISTNVLTADGRTYRITITYDDDAEIPAGTKLVVKEIEPGTDEYLQHLGKAWSEVNKEYFELEKAKQNNNGGLDEYEYEEIRPVNLDDARFFNISLIYQEEEIEPKAPVHVEIEYVEGLKPEAEAEDQVIGVAHYKEEETELIENIKTERNEAGEIIEFIYEQDSFSDIGTYVGQKTYDNIPYEINQALSMPLLRALSNSTGNGPQLEDIEAHKKLTNNEDGTYTMSLTVKGDSVAYEEYNKANILFVMDRSSSMTNNKVYQEYKGSSYPGGTTYYRKNGNNYEELFLNNGQVCTRTWVGLGWVYTPYNGTVYTSVTRLEAEQAAMDVLIQNLLGKNDPDTPGKEDLIEISVISFAEARCSGNTEYLNWTSNDYNGLMAAINQTNTPSGTNWEDALIYAREQAAIKKDAQPDEDVYVIFLTDGEPTAVYGEHDGAQHYIDSWGNDIRGGFEYALTEEGTYQGPGKENDGKNSLDRAKEIVDAGYKLYGIFTFNPGEAQTRYLRRLMNFAYTGVDKAYENDSTKEETDVVKKYFTNADTPETLTAAFEKIFADVSNMLGHGDIVITDGLQAADAMTTTIHADKADGFRYSVTDDTTGNELYYVTATGDDSNPSVTFHINGNDYPAGAPKAGVDGKPYYSVTANGAEYKMALADLSGRELKWDLSAIGMLLPDCTYKVDIIVWPNQAAYDYVAGLNNHLQGYTWDESVESNPENYHEVTVDGETYGYYTGGVAGHSSIVKYKDRDVYSVLTNTHQELNYSIVNTKTNEVTGETTITSDPQTPVQLEPQKPMDLVDTNSKIEKKWNVDLDPEILEQLLHPADGSHYNLDFDIYQDTERNLYKTITLGWEEAQEEYVWQKEYAIPTGLMLSEERMDALGMDKTAYPSGTWPVDPDDPDSEVKTYYLLEDGHDYIIKERGLSYEFDFNADIFHPMLVDGEMQNVNFTKSGMSISISNMTNTTGGLSSLTVENTLRGYIHLEKHVVDQEGAAISTDKTKFEYTIVLTNDDGPFIDTHIPWYGINRLYRHDSAYNYYDVYYDGDVLKLKDEAGLIYPVVGDYDLSDAGEQVIQYRDGEVVKELTLWGNQTNASDDHKTATATLQISQGEVLSIANVPAGTQYTITESAEAGYSLVKIDKRIDPADVAEDPEETAIDLSEGSITGTIVPNHHNYIDYTNRCLVTDITIQKTDVGGEGLEGAVFQLKKVESGGHAESDASAIESVSGLTTITKTVSGETRTYTSALESDGNAQVIRGLPDGTYRLHEVIVPAGYISTYRYIEFKVVDREIKDVTTNTGDTSKLDTQANNIDLVIANEPGAALPSTGGPGTFFLYMFGVLLTGLAGAGLAVRKLRKNVV